MVWYFIHFGDKPDELNFWRHAGRGPWFGAQQHHLHRKKGK